MSNKYELNDEESGTLAGMIISRKHDRDDPLAKKIMQHQYASITKNEWNEIINKINSELLYAQINNHGEEEDFYDDMLIGVESVMKQNHPEWFETLKGKHNDRFESVVCEPGYEYVPGHWTNHGMMYIDGYCRRKKHV